MSNHHNRPVGEIWTKHRCVRMKNTSRESPVPQFIIGEVHQSIFSLPQKALNFSRLHSQCRCRCSTREACPVAGCACYTSHTMRIGPSCLADSPRKTRASSLPPCRAELALRISGLDLNSLSVPCESNRDPKTCDIDRS